MAPPKDAKDAADKAAGRAVGSIDQVLAAHQSGIEQTGNERAETRDPGAASSPTSPRAASAGEAATSPRPTTTTPPRSAASPIASRSEPAEPMDSLSATFTLTDQDRRVLDHDDEFQAFLRRNLFSTPREPATSATRVQERERMEAFRDDVQAAINDALVRNGGSGSSEGSASARSSPASESTVRPGDSSQPAAGGQGDQGGNGGGAGLNPEAPVFRPGQ